MKYMPLIGVALAVWGLAIGDMIRVIAGIGLFMFGFIPYALKQSDNLKDDKVFKAHKALSSLIRQVKSQVETIPAKLQTPQLELAQGLFFVGMIDAFSQKAGMDDEQWNSLFQSVFHDLDYIYDRDYQRELMAFHQSANVSHPAYKAIMSGGDVCLKFLQGNEMAVLVAHSLIEEASLSPYFPDSIWQLNNPDTTVTKHHQAQSCKQKVNSSATSNTSNPTLLPEESASDEDTGLNKTRRNLAEDLLKDLLQPLVGQSEASKFARFGVEKVVYNYPNSLPHERVLVVLVLDYLLELLSTSDDKRLIDLVPKIVSLIRFNMHVAEANAEQDDLPKLRDLGKGWAANPSRQLQPVTSQSSEKTSLPKIGLEGQVERIVLEASDLSLPTTTFVEQSAPMTLEGESQCHETNVDEIPVATIGDDSQCKDATTDDPLMVFTPSKPPAPKVLQKLHLADAKDILSDFEEFHDDLGSGFFYDESLLPWPKELIMRSIYTILRDPSLREHDEHEYVAAAYLVYEIVKYQPDIGNEPFDNSSYDRGIVKAILDSNRSDEEKQRAVERHMSNRQPYLRDDLEQTSAAELAILTHGLKEFDLDDE